jgi:tetratricopeptide (TPR) repeat protein
MRPVGCVLAALFLVLVANSFYLAAFAQASLFYMGNVLAHVVLGALVLAGFVWALARCPEFRARVKWAALPLLMAGVLGAVLVKTGALLAYRWLVWSHVLFALAGTIVLVATARWRPLTWVFSVSALGCLLVVGYGAAFPDPHDSIRNSLVVPVAMTDEGGGPQSPFWPSAAKTNAGGLIPASFFMDSRLCGECHQDIYRQWESSMHHFSSFNNQFYRKAVEHMQEISGTQGSKWCAGCHDHAMFFNGRFEKPAKDQTDTPEAQNGLGCVSCHSIVHVNGSVGNGGFTIMYPPLHELASSHNPYIRMMDGFLTKLDPEPHRRTFLKPFMRNQNAEFCSVCHKVHLDDPVNHYRWLRGFNEYDNWQASGVSGQGARSFYYPDKPMNCADCHMPLVRSNDFGNRDGYVHNHRFAAANTAVPTANGDVTQLRAAEGFLQSGFISVDIFAVSPDEKPPGLAMARRAGDAAQQAMSTFAVGEEAETASQAFLRKVGDVAAPIDHAAPRPQPGSTARVDVVVRTRKIGHFFPGGTVDAQEVWLELEGRDSAGKVIYWSGRVEQDGRGPVEKGAHFYRSLMLDDDGNPVNKRNAWQTRSVLYVRLIPPGAADVAHFRVHIPKDAKGPLFFTAKLNYRKFTRYFTQFAYAGRVLPNQDPNRISLGHDSREYDFSPANISKNVSGQIRDRIPDLPIVTLAHDEARIELSDGAAATVWRPVVRREDRERWNDWGIGLLLQGDLKGAEYAFERVTEADPDYADGWLNVARALIQEGETEAAKSYIAKALKVDSSLGRIHFFKAMTEKADGDYDAALSSLRVVEAQYPRDRVVQNQIGRILFLKRDYRAAVEAFHKVLAVDPEDIQAHYNLMLCLRGLGDADAARREQRLFLRFKADEASQTLTAKLRLISPEDNNERQAIHEHESVALP